MWPFKTKQQKLDSLCATLERLKARRDTVTRNWKAGCNFDEGYSKKVASITEKIVKLERKIDRLSEQ